MIFENLHELAWRKVWFLFITCISCFWSEKIRMTSQIHAVFSTYWHLFRALWKMTCFHEVATFSVSSRRFSLLSLGFCWVHAYEIWDTEPIYARRARLSTIDWPANKNPGVNCKRLTNLTTHLTNLTNVPNNILDLVNKSYFCLLFWWLYSEKMFLSWASLRVVPCVLLGIRSYYVSTCRDWFHGLTQPECGGSTARRSSGGLRFWRVTAVEEIGHFGCNHMRHWTFWFHNLK